MKYQKLSHESCLNLKVRCGSDLFF
ncbi:hypothetical protein NC653_004825 [Populus alba x Populus x berolinensis]|uniref:Uncharacterized protein n=1 Tax=Populus alba x Populus x berolinensis TaxID=444605 RepID=A0AAD6RW02_9ROSI|nr:hypothetical protein NC653_004825 [Populus alba x Populus x berolinensis]